MERPHRRRARVNGNVFAPPGANLQEDPSGALVRDRLVATRFRRQ